MNKIIIFVINFTSIFCSESRLKNGENFNYPLIDWKTVEINFKGNNFLLFHAVKYSEKAHTLTQASRFFISNNEIHMKNVTLSDERKYEISIVDKTGMKIFDEFMITIIIPPSLELSGLDVLVSDLVESKDAVSVARCFASGGKPSAKVSWNSDILGTLDHLTSDVQSVLTIKPTRYMNKAIVECVIKHEALEHDIIKRMELNVQFIPDVPTIRFHQPDCLNMKKLNLVCEDASTLPSNPSVDSFDWSIPGDSISVSGSSIVIDTNDLDPNEEYIYKCAARNAVGVSSFQEKSLTQLQDEFCPIEAKATSGGLGFLWIIIIIIILILICLIVCILVVYFRKKKLEEKRQPLNVDKIVIERSNFGSVIKPEEDVYMDASKDKYYQSLVPPVPDFTASRKNSSQLSEDVSVIYMTPKEGSRKEGPVPAPRSPGHISAQHSSHKSSSRNSARKSRSSNRTNPEGILGSLHDYDPLQTVHV